MGLRCEIFRVVQNNAWGATLAERLCQCMERHHRLVRSTIMISAPIPSLLAFKCADFADLKVCLRGRACKA
jgi:hypothetical protein